MTEPTQPPRARYSLPAVDAADGVSRKRSVGGTRVGDRRGNAPAFSGDDRVDPEPEFVDGTRVHEKREGDDYASRPAAIFSVANSFTPAHVSARSCVRQRWSGGAAAAAVPRASAQASLAV